MLPEVIGRTYSNSVLPEYIRRILHYPQMDIEYTFWQMFYLCWNPHRVYRTTSWHKRKYCIYNNVLFTINQSNCLFQNFYPYFAQLNIIAKRFIKRQYLMIIHRNQKPMGSR